VHPSETPNGSHHVSEREAREIEHDAVLLDALLGSNVLSSNLHLEH